MLNSAPSFSEGLSHGCLRSYVGCKKKTFARSRRKLFVSLFLKTYCVNGHNSNTAYLRDYLREFKFPKLSKNFRKLFVLKLVYWKFFKDFSNVSFITVTVVSFDGI